MIRTTPDKKILWIAWEKHRRTIELCNYFGINLIIYNNIRNRIAKYIVYSLKSIINIIHLKPAVLIVQNPSIVLTFIACLLKPIFRYKLLADTHNAGLMPESNLLKMFPFVYRYFQKAADITIVTNSELANIVTRNNGRPFVMPDKLPEISLSRNDRAPKNKFKIVYICTFGIDEPYMQFIEAAGHFNSDILFFVTGKWKMASNLLLTDRPANLIFTDFLPDDEYWDLLLTSDLIIDLTNRQDCLVCGAYEAVAAEVPLVLSDTTALRKHFNKGVVFTSNTTDDIAKNINNAINNIQYLKSEIVCLKSDLQNDWNQIAQTFRNHLEKCN